MAVFAGPEISNSWLVLYLDAPNIKSYDSRQNLFTNSNDFTTANWTYQQNTNTLAITSTTVLDPFDTYTASKISIINTGTFYSATRAATINSNTNYSYSIYFKLAEITQGGVTLFTGAVNNSISFNLSTGQITNTATNDVNLILNSTTITPVNNGWYRVQYNFRHNQGGTFQFKLDLTNNLNVNNGLLVYGAQLEQNITATRYTATTGTTVTKQLTWVDLSGQNNTGTLVNLPSVSLDNNSSFIFNGTNNFVTISSSTSINSAVNITVLSWFLISSFPDFSQYRIINHQQTGNNAWGLQIGRGDYVGGFSSSTTIMFCHSNNGVTAQNYAAPTNLALNTWYHGGFTNDGTTLRIYLNGVLDASAASLGNQFQPINSNVCIGVTSQGQNSFYFIGKIASAQVYNRALTASEVRQIFEATRDRYGV